VSSRRRFARRQAAGVFAQIGRFLFGETAGGTAGFVVWRFDIACAGSESRQGCWVGAVQCAMCARTGRGRRGKWKRHLSGPGDSISRKARQSSIEMPNANRGGDHMCPAGSSMVAAKTISTSLHLGHGGTAQQGANRTDRSFKGGAETGLAGCGGRHLPLRRWPSACLLCDRENIGAQRKADAGCGNASSSSARRRREGFVFPGAWLPLRRDQRRPRAPAVCETRLRRQLGGSDSRAWVGRIHGGDTPTPPNFRHSHPSESNAAVALWNRGSRCRRVQARVRHADTALAMRGHSCGTDCPFRAGRRIPASSPPGGSSDFVRLRLGTCRGWTHVSRRFVIRCADSRISCAGEMRWWSGREAALACSRITLLVGATIGNTPAACGAHV